ncbi:Gfo/Idh/MocA family oxidoreductase [Anaeromyxobacter paludicola]|uniref:Gfo/Idh/MocA-like oxidoreductase C-terminal domain-containing protein n=1 Tax=Anaeromyxobacter paludicola TaxID=2918171 RepID=A0ABM7XFY3_9BACT|nr:Gfo/Idh/MocA family oxidoreductase [Anaeromyxobacter paludicola]BDG10798.1 hypothetical protein AMPC_39110 [Anaeromyxobacter paludicola]
MHEAWSALLRFPEERLAAFTCSFGAAATGNYRLVCTQGELHLDPAYEYVGELVRYLSLGEKKTSRKPYRQKDQFAPELLHFSDCILRDREPEPSGWEGLADVRVIEAVLRSAREHRPVNVEPVERTRHPSRELEQRLPAVEKPETVDVQAPSE